MCLLRGRSRLAASKPSLRPNRCAVNERGRLGLFSANGYKLKAHYANGAPASAVVLLISRRIHRNKFSQAQNRGLIARFAVHLVNAFPHRLSFGGWLGSRKGDFHFQAIQRAAKHNPAGRARGMAMEAVLAGRHHRTLKLQNGFVAQSSGIGKIAGRAPDSGHQALVRVHLNRDLMR